MYEDSCIGANPQEVSASPPAAQALSIRTTFFLLGSLNPVSNCLWVPKRMFRRVVAPKNQARRRSAVLRSKPSSDSPWRIWRLLR